MSGDTGFSRNNFTSSNLINMQHQTNQPNQPSWKLTGILFLIGSVAVMIPYTILTVNFNYPAILRENTATILEKFHNGGASLIWTWFAFAITGLPLVAAFVFMGQKLESRSPIARLATTIGVIGLLVQVLGLLRWTFVVPVLANQFLAATTEAGREAAISSFNTIHQYGGVLLGEHLGQLFTITWSVLVCIILLRTGLFARWVSWLGLISSFIYLLAQAELFATVLPGFPVWPLAGLLGSTLWLLWMIILAALLIRKKAIKVSE